MNEKLRKQYDAQYTKTNEVLNSYLQERIKLKRIEDQMGQDLEKEQKAMQRRSRQIAKNMKEENTDERTNRNS